MDKMYASMNKADWKEDQAETALRAQLVSDSDPQLMRMLYPFKGRTVKFDRMNQLPVGTELDYVRPKLEPSFYPLEALIFQGRIVRKSSYSSEELEMVDPSE